jgi:chemotaxis protein MotB
MRKIFIVVGLFLFIIQAGCVMQKTFDLKEQEARSLDNSLQESRKQNEELSQEKSGLNKKVAELTRDKIAMGETNADLYRNKEDLLNRVKDLEGLVAELSKDKEALVADNRQLDGVLKAKSDSLSRTISEMRQANVELKEVNEARIAELTTRIAGLETENVALKEEMTAQLIEKEKKVQQMSSTYGELLEKMKGEIEKGEITISELKGRLTVNMVDAILFDSGKAEIKPSGLEVLQRVVEILVGVQDKMIRIEGHTDNVPIVGLLARTYPTNWELSAGRAINVTRFLELHGIDTRSLEAVAYGEFRPVADNSTDEGRARNRRIEIILAAKDE